MQSQDLEISKNSLEMLKKNIANGFDSLSSKFSLTLLENTLSELHESFEYVRDYMVEKDIQSLRVFFKGSLVSYLINWNTVMKKTMNFSKIFFKKLLFPILRY